MKERPILFSGPMVRAILDGSKTQTRRVMNPQPPEFDHATRHHQRILVPGSPYGQPGDHLWVREAHRMLDCCCDTCRVNEHVHYEADGGGYSGAFQGRLRPSIHMPRWASRILLEIVSVRVERLNDISEKDCWAEGCEGFDDDVTGGKSGYREFAELWESINGKGSWGANPWVWCIEFRRVDQ